MVVMEHLKNQAKDQVIPEKDRQKRQAEKVLAMKN